MTVSEEPIKVIDLAQVDEKAFINPGANAVVLTKDGKLLLQQRPPEWRVGGGQITTFGGGIELGETPLQALVRELKEELGANVLAADVVNLGVLTEAFTNHTELVYAYFWQDKQGTITGCYECEAVYFDDVSTVFAQSNLMDYVRWMLRESQKRGLLNT